MESCKVEASLVALTDAAFDKDEGVRWQIKLSLHDLGCHNPELVLRTCLEFLVKHKQLVQGHRMAIISSMEAIVRDTVKQLSQTLGKNIISMASDEMTKSSEGVEVDKLKEEASNLLVAVGCRFSDEVLAEIQQKLQPGHLPQFHEVQTLGKLSVANVYGVVPHLPGILQTMTPMLSMARQDHMKMAFTSVLGLFAQSILEYLEHSDRAPNPVLKKSLFSQEMYACYKILFSGWLRNKDNKLRSAIVVSLSYMVHLIPDEKLEDELPKLISGILTLYKKRCEPFYVTRCIWHILDTGVHMTSQVLDSQIDNLLPPLHHQICSSLDPNNELTLKNHSEILQCFTILAQVSIDSLVKFLLQKLSNNNERVRIGTLVSLNHIVGSGFKHLESKKPLIVAAMKLALLDNDNKVKKLIAQVINTMGAQGYLELEGGLALVEFLVNQCSLYKNRWLAKSHHTEPNEVMDEDLSRICEDILISLTTLTKMEDVLWPFLLEFITPLQYTNALAVVCTSLEQVGARKLELGPERMMLNYNERLGLPKSHTLLARLLAIASSPFQGKDRGIPALKLLRIMSYNIHPLIVKLWNDELPGLIQYLMDNTEESLPQKLWEDKLFLFLSRTLECITDEKWTWQLSEETIKHLCNYYSYPKEKAFLYKCVGIVLGQTQNKEVINNELQEMLLSVQHNESLEREGLATGIGFCAMTHLDDTLVKLDDFVRMDIVKKTASFFNILKEKLDGDMERVKSTLILCYGYVALYAPESVILSRIEGDILEHILNLSNTKVLGIKIESKDLMIKLTLIKAVTLVAKAIYANKGKSDFTFNKKDELLSYMQDFIVSEPKGYLKSRVRQSSINACMHLVKLEPLLDEAGASELIKTCLESVFSFLPVDSEKRKESKKLKEREALYNETTGALQDLLKELLLQNLSSDGLEFIFKALEEWVTSNKDHERERAMETVHKLLIFYREKFKITRVTVFHNLGSLIGRLVPRCADPLLNVRQLTMDSLQTLLYIQLRYEGCILNQRDDLVEHLKGIRSQLENPDSQILFQICYDIAKVVSTKLPQDQLSPLLFTLFEGLSDYHSTCSSAASVVMNTLIRRHKSGLGDHIQEILQRLRVRMQSITLEQVKFSVVHFISILTSQCMPAVISCLLLSPLPYDTYTNDIWQSLAREVTLASTTMEHLIDKLNDYMCHDETKEHAVINDKAMSPGVQEPMAIVFALNAMISNPDSEDAVSSLYPQLFSTLLLNLSFIVNERTSSDFHGKGSPRKKRAAAHGQGPAAIDICRCSADTLRTMLARGKSERVAGFVEEEGGWDTLRSLEKHQQGIAILSKAMGQHGTGHLNNIVQILEPILLSIHESQRMTVATFFGELLNSSVVNELQLTDPLIVSLLKSLHDKSPNVHWLSLRGLGNVANGAPQKVQKYSERLLEAMIEGMTNRTERSDLIVLEAMSGLSKVLLRLEESDVRPTLENIIVAVRSYFESEVDRIRAGAFTVFGNLSRFAEGESRAVFMEHVHSGMVSLLLHLNDSSPEVVKACKATLHLMGPLMCSDSMCTIFQAELLEQANAHYWEFINELAKLIACEFPDKLSLYLTNSTSFFKSMLPEVRGNAVIMAGFLLQNLPEMYVQPSTDENVCVAIIMMLHDVAPSVRIKAAKVLGLHRGF